MTTRDDLRIGWAAEIVKSHDYALRIAELEAKVKRLTAQDVSQPSYDPSPGERRRVMGDGYGRGRLPWMNDDRQLGSS